MFLLGRNCATVSRLIHCYFDKNLKDFNIGSGQQFCLLRILENPGISCKTIAENGHFDLATILRATQKLESLEYIKSVVDENDKRIKKLYITDSGKVVAKRTKEILEEYYKLLLEDISREELVIARKVLDRVIFKTLEILEK